VPNEMRKIVFTADELQAALVNYALRTNKKLPNATINNILVEEKEGVTATIVYMRDGTDEAKSVEFTPNDVAAAIILYCNTRQIPLPRDAKKVVIPIEGSVGMIIKIDTYGNS
ncbi:uncharacterized protein METZ01_LOCUS389736, partial [marine metagenome]